MKFILLFLSLFSLLFAEPIVNVDANKFSTMDFELSYFIDNSNEIKFQDIKSIKFQTGKNRDSLGAKVKNVWIKIKLFNSTKEEQTLFLHQDLAYKYTSIEYYNWTKCCEFCLE